MKTEAWRLGLLRDAHRRIHDLEQAITKARLIVRKDDDPEYKRLNDIDKLLGAL